MHMLNGRNITSLPHHRGPSFSPTSKRTSFLSVMAAKKELVVVSMRGLSECEVLNVHMCISTCAPVSLFLILSLQLSVHVPHWCVAEQNLQASNTREEGVFVRRWAVLTVTSCSR